MTHRDLSVGMQGERTSAEVLFIRPRNVPVAPAQERRGARGGTWSPTQVLRVIARRSRKNRALFVLRDTRRRHSRAINKASQRALWRAPVGAENHR
jgi:hypothetical protein